MAQRGDNRSQEVAEVPQRRGAEVCIEWIETMGEHSLLLKLHLEHEVFLRQTIAQLQQRICEETDHEAKVWLEEYKKELEQRLKHEVQELCELRGYELPEGDERGQD